MALKHAKISAIADGPNTSQVLPSDWNAEHKVDFTNALVRADGTGALVAGPAITISTEDPSGGNDGDIWIKYTP